jgi:protein-tyrosine phosphatase
MQPTKEVLILEQETNSSNAKPTDTGEAGRIGLEKLPNTRDLGYLSTQDNRQVVSRKLIRSGALSGASGNDLKTLTQTYQVQTVLDLRTPEEREKSPDPQEDMPGVRFDYAPILGFAATGITRENGLEGLIGKLKSSTSELGDPRQLLAGLYPRMFLDKLGVQGYTRFFDILANTSEGAVLWHCSAGKDRAGMAAVLLLHVLEVSPDAILADYLATNQFLTGRTNELKKLIPAEHFTPELEQALTILNSTDQSFLDAGIQAVQKEYGSLDTYLKDALGVDKAMKEHLRSKYLE